MFRSILKKTVYFKRYSGSVAVCGPVILPWSFPISISVPKFLAQTIVASVHSYELFLKSTFWKLLTLISILEFTFDVSFFFTLVPLVHSGK